MKIENLEQYSGKRVFFCLEESKYGNGDRYDTYFTTLNEAADYAAVAIHHTSDVVSVCYGNVDSDGSVNSWDEVSRVYDGYDHLKESSILRHFFDNVSDAMSKAYQDVLESGGFYEIKIYINSDGNIITEQFTDSNWSIKSDEYFHVFTAKAPNFDYHDYIDGYDYEGAEQEVIDSLVYDYDVYAILEGIIQTIEENEEYSIKENVL